jgi:transaldolase
VSPRRKAFRDGGVVRGAVFLDRDGVLNEPLVRNGRPHPPADAEALVLCPGAAGALAALRGAGFTLIVVSNQPDIARGTTSRATVDAINDRLRAELPLDDVLICPHDDTDGCDCRKPKPGLLRQGARLHEVDLARSYLVGDRWRDIEAGAAAGCTTVFVDRGYTERQPVAPDARVASIVEAARWIIDHPRSTMQAVDPAHDFVKTDALRVKLFADGADLDGIAKLAADPRIAGFTTNPTLMRKAAIADYEAFSRKVLGIITGRPISFEVFADEPGEMLRQARKLSSWGDNVYVKIPVTDTAANSTDAVVRELTRDGVKVNVTALMTEAQVAAVLGSLAGTPGAYVSVFAGRIADTGRDPVPAMRRNAVLCETVPNVELIWASPRELLNVFQADAAGVHVITATHDILAKLDLVGKDLDEYSLDTVKMFHRDAAAAGYTL